MLLSHFGEVVLNKVIDSVIMKNKIRLSIFKKAFMRDVKIIKVSFVIIIFVVIGCAFNFTLHTYKGITENFKINLSKKDSIIGKVINDFSPKTSVSQQLKEQFEIIKEMKKSHIAIASYYSEYNFTFSIFFTIFTVISGVLGFLLLKKGWDNTNNYYLKSSFLIAFFCTSLFGILPNVFVNKENIKNNLHKYNVFNNIQLDIYSLVKDNEGLIRQKTPQSLDTLNSKILSITKRIKINQDLYFDINIDKVPTEVKINQ